jgi:hypothetical protein
VSRDVDANGRRLGSDLFVDLLLPEPKNPGACVEEFVGKVPHRFGDERELALQGILVEAPQLSAPGTAFLVAQGEESVEVKPVDLIAILDEDRYAGTLASTSRTIHVSTRSNSRLQCSCRPTESERYCTRGPQAATAGSTRTGTGWNPRSSKNSK